MITLTLLAETDPVREYAVEADDVFGRVRIDKLKPIARYSGNSLLMFPPK